MNLSHLISLIEQVSGYQQLIGKLQSQEKDIKLVVSDAVKPFIIAALHKGLNLPVLVIVAQPESAKRLYDELQAWCPISTLLQYFPETDFLTGEYFATDVVVAAERLRTLSSLTRCRDISARGQSPLIISSALAVVSRTMSRNGFIASCRDLSVKMNIDPLQLLKEWQAVGYELEDIVEVPGTMSRRGGIVDVFSPDSEFPARIEFVGNQIESIRLFVPKTQRSLKLVTSVTIAPARESQQHLNGDTILDYLPEEALLITDDIDELKTVIDKLDCEAEEFRQMKVGHGESAPNLPVLSWPEFKARTSRIGQRLRLCSWNMDDSDKACIQSLPLIPVSSYGGRLAAFSEGLREMLKENRRIVVVSQQTNRLAELLQEQDITACSVSQIEQMPPLKSVTLVHGSMVEGWAMKNVFTLFTDNEVFGFVKQRRLFKKRPVRHHWFISGLTPGDYIVHIEHGIAKFAGLTKMLNDDVEL
jgi:transcription-repair coupling factor (superfamily II helicase)